MTLGFKGIHGSGQRMLLNQNDVRVICRQGENGNTGLRQTGCEFSEYSDFSKIECAIDLKCSPSRLMAQIARNTRRVTHDAQFIATATH